MTEFGAAADTGAGIGRVTKDLLADLFDKIDLVEPVFYKDIEQGDYLEQVRSRGKLGRVYGLGLQDWTPEVGRYDGKYLCLSYVLTSK